MQDFHPTRMALSALVTVSMAILPALPALSQESIEAENKPLEEVIVTATRTGQRALADVPMAISAFSGAALEDGFITDINSLSETAPGLQVTSNVNIAAITIRGIGSNTTLSGGETSSALHLDGVYQARPSTALFNFFDIERVEVLRGPQGTLYGRNATGGSINIITRKPADTNSVEATVFGGSDNYKRIDAVFNGAPADGKMRLRAGVQRILADGFIDNRFSGASPDIGEQDRLQLRGRILIKPQERFELDVGVDYTEIDETPLYYAKPLLGLGIGEAYFADIHTVSIDSDPVYTHTAWGVRATATLDLNREASLQSLTSYRESDMLILGDLDATNIPFLQTNPLPEVQNQFSQELTLSYTRDRMEALVGLYYFEEDVDSYFLLNVFPAGITQRQGRVTGTKAEGAFAQINYELSPQWALIAGARYSNEDKTGIASGAVNLLTGTQLLSYENAPETMSSKVWTPRLGLEYRTNRDGLMYVSTTRGFKAGGFNFIANPDEDSAFLPETAWSWESGYKSQIWNGRAQISMSAFYMSYKDLQVVEFLGAGTERVRNADATTKGLEVEVNAELGTGFHLDANAAYLDATYSGDFQSLDPIAGAAINANGNRLNNAPRWSGALALGWLGPLGQGVLRARLEGSFKSLVFYSSSNNALERQNGLGLLNGQLAYAFSQDRHEVALNVRNAFDKKYIEGAALFLGPTGRPARGRMVILSLKASY